MIFKPVTSEKAVKLIDIENTLLFEIDRRSSKDKTKEDFEKVFEVKVKKVRTLVRGNKKYAYITLKKENPAIDLATKLGMM